MIIDFREREKEGERGRETLMWELPPACALTGNQTCNLGMCPDQVSHLQTLDLPDDAPINWATLARAENYVLKYLILVTVNWYYHWTMVISLITRKSTKKLYRLQYNYVASHQKSSTVSQQWLSWLGVVPQTIRSWVWFPVGVHALVVGLVPDRGMFKRQPTYVFLSSQWFSPSLCPFLPFFLESIKKPFF